jgi:lipopolysaccharide export system protein LptA
MVSSNAMKVQSLPDDRITWMFGSVAITHGATVLHGDSAWASSVHGTATIWGHFRLIDRTAVITGQKAVYDKAAGRAVVYGHPRASDNGWDMDADSIVFIKPLDRSFAYGTVTLADTAGRSRVDGSYCEYWHDRAYGLLTGRPRFTMINRDSARPSSLVDADRMEIEQGGRKAVGSGNVQYQGDSVWASCQRLTYYKEQGRIELEQEPRIWQQGSDLRAAAIELRLEGDSLRTAWGRDSVTLRQFAAESPDTDVITGDSLWADFEHRKIARARVMSDAWSRYHQQAGGRMVGRNLAAGAAMDFTFSDGRISRITISTGARGAYHEQEQGKGKAQP